MISFAHNVQHIFLDTIWRYHNSKKKKEKRKHDVIIFSDKITVHDWRGQFRNFGISKQLFLQTESLEKAQAKIYLGKID